MKFKHRAKHNKNRATNLPSPPHTGATTATNNVTTICTPKRGATKGVGYTTSIVATRSHLHLSHVRKENSERISDRRGRSKFAIVLPSKTRINPAQQDEPSPNRHSIVC